MDIVVNKLRVPKFLRTAIDALAASMGATFEIKDRWDALVEKILSFLLKTMETVIDPAKEANDGARRIQ